MPSLESVNEHRKQIGAKPLTRKEYDAVMSPSGDPKAVAPRLTPLPEGLALDEPKAAPKKANRKKK